MGVKSEELFSMAPNSNKTGTHLGSSTVFIESTRRSQVWAGRGNINYVPSTWQTEGSFAEHENPRCTRKDLRCPFKEHGTGNKTNTYIGTRRLSMSTNNLNRLERRLMTEI